MANRPPLDLTGAARSMAATGIRSDDAPATRKPDPAPAPPPGREEKREAATEPGGTEPGTPDPRPEPPPSRHLAAAPGGDGTRSPLRGLPEPKQREVKKNATFALYPSVAEEASDAARYLKLYEDPEMSLNQFVADALLEHSRRLLAERGLPSWPKLPRDR